MCTQEPHLNTSRLLTAEIAYMSKLIEKHLAKLAGRIEPKPSGSNISSMIAQHIKQHDPKSKLLRSQYAAHFDTLFSGLHTLDAVHLPSPETQVEILGHKDPYEAVQLFKALYYQGKLSHRAAVTALQNHNLQVMDIATIFRLVDEGGTLIRWPKGDRLFFDLKAASRFWVLGVQELARRMICESFETYKDWINASIDRMPAPRVRVLAQALRAASPQLSEQLVASANVVRPLWVLWVEFRGAPRQHALQKLSGLLHSDIIELISTNLTHSGLTKAAPSSESQVVELLHQLELVEPQHEKRLRRALA